MSLNEMLNNLIDPFYKDGDNIVGEIRSKFLYGSSAPLEVARTLAIKYAQQEKILKLNRVGVLDFVPLDLDVHDYALWARAISDGNENNWETMSQLLELDAFFRLTEPREGTLDLDIGQSLLNLAGSLE